MTGLLKFTGWTIVAAIAYAASAGCTQEKSFGEYCSRGVAKERLGRYKEALADYRICLEMLDDSPGDNRMRAAVEKRMREIEDNQREGRSE